MQKQGYFYNNDYKKWYILKNLISKWKEVNKINYGIYNLKQCYKIFLNGKALKCPIILENHIIKRFHFYWRV